STLTWSLAWAPWPVNCAVNWSLPFSGKPFA
ncbi:MAG: hypothetical protein QOD34_2446, partial [Mycobacterium sp.]|nr:hypothetical protein [Mycobacterium sp.]